MDGIEVGRRIQEKRKELGLSQDDLAVRLGLNSKSSRSVISKLEKNANNITTDRVRQIAKALGVTPGYLMGWEDNLTEGSAIAMANIIKNSDDTEFMQKYNSLSEENKKEVHRFVDFLISKNVSDQNK